MIDPQPEGGLMQRHIIVQDKAWKSRLAGVPQRYEEEFSNLEGVSLRNARVEGNCLVCRTAVGAGARSKALGVMHIL